MGKFKDMKDQRFGRLEVKEYAGNNKRGDALWLCLCDCGQKTIAKGRNLRTGATKSCGCLFDEIKVDILGRRFGRLVVKEPVERKKGDKNQAQWKCICDCGKTVVSGSNDLRSGKTQSCGCYNIDRIKEAKTTHGGSKTRLYGIWRGMRRRCYNPSDLNYRLYGGRGILIYKDWDDFATFQAWAFNNGYTDSLTIDRIDNNGSYTPDNCRWTDMKSQCRNRNNNKIMDVDGSSLCLVECEEQFGVKVNTISSRIKQLKWDEETAIKTPKKENYKGKKILPFNGEELSIAEWGRRTGIDQKTIRHRIAVGEWSIEKALTTPVRGAKTCPAH